MSDPERDLAISYAPAHTRAALHALFGLDDALAAILVAARDPMLRQMRLTWWHGALAALDTAPPPVMPVLSALANDVLPHGVSGAALADLVEGWELLVEAEALDADVLARVGELRGARLFGIAGRVLGASDALAAAGAGWALVDLSRRLDAGDGGTTARMIATPLLDRALAVRWSREGRALGALAHLARCDLAVPCGAPVPTGSPGRVARMAWHRMTGR